MKLLLITALYPPYHLGGYELRSQDVTERLQARGHEVHVITSAYGVGKPCAEDKIARVLHLEPSKDMLQRLQWDAHDLRFIAQTLGEYQPDIIYLWHMAELARTIYPFLAELHIPIVFDEGGNGLTLAWKNHGRWISFCEGKTAAWPRAHLSASSVRWYRKLRGSLSLGLAVNAHLLQQPARA